MTGAERPSTARPSTGVGEPPGSSPWSAWVDRSCRKVEAARQWRRPRPFDAWGPVGGLTDEAGAVSPGTRSEAAPVVSFASNDYLGLTIHPEVVASAHRALDRWGSGAGASRLITGSRPVHAELESALASWKRCERAVVFPTGFAANLSVLSVFGAEGAHVFSDELNHASIIDGCRLGRADVTVYPHGDLAELDAAVARSAGLPIIVSDTVFSMDGDRADLAGLVTVAARHHALLVLDEAHAVLGPELSEAVPEAQVEVLRVGTLSKTLGSLGGFVAGPARFTELLVNRARPYIFTTATTPADAAAALAALGIVRSPGAPSSWNSWPATSHGWGRRWGGPATPRPSSRWSWGTRRRRSGYRTISCPEACGSRPSGLRPSPGGRPVSGSPCRPATPTSTSTD